MPNNLSEKDLNTLKKWLKEHLEFGEVTIAFDKVDGTERVMKCTLNSGIIPAQPIVEDAEPKKPKKINEDVCRVYDIESAGWRSFRWDSLKRVSFEL
jgi:uncharacterized protein YtpQ (UPF0354 family)